MSSGTFSDVLLVSFMGKELKTFPVVRIFLDLAGLEFQFSFGRGGRVIIISYHEFSWNLLIASP